MLATEDISGHSSFGGNTNIYESVKRFSLRGLSDLIRVLMENMDDALFDLSEKSESDRERNMYFEAMREIRLKRSAMQIAFDQEMQECFTRLSNNKTVTSDTSELDELSLVELDDIEDKIAIDNMISKARPHFEDDLFAIEERLKIVLHRNKILKDLNPLDPKAICDSFHNAAEVIESDIQVKLIFYKLFDIYVMSNLEHFYRELNDFFIEKGVLPEFKASQERMKQTSQFMANRIKKASVKADTSNITNESARQQSDSEINSTTPPQDGGLLSLLQQMLTSGPVSQGNIAGAAASGSDAWQPLGGLAEPQQGLIPVAQNPGYMTALTNLQTSNLRSLPPGSTNPNNLRTEMQQQLVAFNREYAHQASTAENQIIDIVSMLFDFFFDDEALPDPVKVLIGRLQIPILKVAIIDSSFFNHKKHPARKLLDSISKATLGWGEDLQHDKILIDKIEQVVDYLLAEFEQDIAVFESALDDFTRFLKQENERLKQADELVRHQELEKEQKIEKAHKVSAKLIQKLIANREMSFGVTDFLESIWASVLFNVYLTMGESSNHWKNIRRISSTFIWTLVPKFTEQERLKIIRTLPSLLRALSKGMELVQVPTEEQNKIFQMLAQEHSKIVKQTSKNIVTRVDDKTVWPEANAADAFSGFTRELANEEIDFEFVADETGEIQIIDKQDDPDAITNITETATDDVIRNLEDFTEGVKKGDIQIDEEIVLDSTEKAVFHAQPCQETDSFLEQAQALEIGSWVEFVEDGLKAQNARLSWKSNVTGKLVFVNRQGHKVKNMTSYGFATELRASRVKLIQSSSVFDRAINTIMTKIKH